MTSFLSSSSSSPALSGTLGPHDYFSDYFSSLPGWGTLLRFSGGWGISYSDAWSSIFSPDSRASGQNPTAHPPAGAHLSPRTKLPAGPQPVCRQRTLQAA